MREHIMIVDGYNVIGNWPELAKLKAEDHFDVARDRLLDILAEYRSHENAKMIVVFDAMYVPGIGKSYAKWDLQVVFTKEDETADSYIERLAQDMNSPLVQLSSLLATKLNNGPSSPAAPCGSAPAIFSKKSSALIENSTTTQPTTPPISPGATVRGITTSYSC